MLHVVPAGIVSFPSGYTIERALFFDGSTDYLTRTFGSGGNTKTWTFSTWAKRADTWVDITIFAQGDYNGEYTSLYFDGNEKLYLNERRSGAWNSLVKSAAQFRDPTAWVHFVVSYDVTPSTPSASSIKLFVNGAEVTVFDTTPTYAAQNADTTLNEASEFNIGRYPANDPGGTYKGYLAETILVDGTALNADSFGEYDSNGVWVPIRPPTSLGTTGFHLDFKSSTVGKDAAGSNNFTAVGMGTNNVVADTCSDNSNTEVTLFPCLDSNNKESSLVLSSENLKAENDSASSWQSVLGSIGLSSGRFYWEITRAYSGHGYDTWGVAGDYKRASDLDRGGAGAITFDTTASSIRKYVESTSAASYYASGTGSASGNVIGVDLDVDNDTIELIVGGTGRGTLDISGLAKPLFPVSMIYTGGSVDHVYNFGASSYTHTKPGAASNITATVTGVGNYPTINPTVPGVGTVSNKNLSGATTSGAGAVVSFVATQAISSGKFYWEVTLTAGSSVSSRIGIATIDSVSATVPTSSVYIGQETTNDKTWAFNAWAADSHDGKIEYGNGSAQRASYAEGVGGFVKGNVVGVALDMDNGALWFSKNGTWMGANLSAGNAATISEIAAGTVTNAAVGPNANCADNINLSSLTVIPVFTVDGVTATTTINFGQNPFSYAVPSGFKKLTTANLPAPTVTKSSDFFQAIAYAGGTDATVDGLEKLTVNTNFQADWVWIKDRGSRSHAIFDSLRGAGKIQYSDGNYADDTNEVNGYLDQFNATNFRLSAGSTSRNNVAGDGNNYVAWCWNAGGEPTTDNDNTSGAMDDGSVFKGGSVQSSFTPSGSPSIYPKKMSIASHGGFSIIEYVGTGSNLTYPHGLDRAPEVVLNKSSASSTNWIMYHSGISVADSGAVTAKEAYLSLNQDIVPQDDATQWNDTDPTTTLVSLGSGGAINGNTNTMISYCFAKTTGLIGIGSYIGNNSANGPNIVVDDGGFGFKPAWVMTKEISNAGNWRIYDNVRDGYNPTDKYLRANTTEGDNTGGDIDFLANGFKIRNNGGESNSSGDKFIYLAFAENPFGGDGVAQAKAR